MAVHLGGAVNVVNVFVPLIREHGSGGHIVNTSSIAASRSNAVDANCATVFATCPSSTDC